jgi:hypothetical protein
MGMSTLPMVREYIQRTNNSLNLNYRNGKFNIFGNFSANYRESFNRLDIKRAV